MSLRKTRFYTSNGRFQRLFVSQMTSKFRFFLSSCSFENLSPSSQSSPNTNAGNKNLPSPDSQAENSPFVYSTVDLEFKKNLFEQPFIFKIEKKKKRTRKKVKAAKSKDKSETLQDVIAPTTSEEDSPTVAEAINIFNAIPKEEKGFEGDVSAKVKEKSSSDLIEELRNNKAHILGLSDSELLLRYKFLCNHGMEKVEALKTALTFPSFLNIHTENVENLMNLYASYKIDLPKMFQSFPFVFSLNYNEVVKKLEHLGSLGLKKKDVSDLINSNPIIICFAVNDTAKNALKFATGFSGWKSLAGKSSFIESLLKTSLQSLAVKYDFDENFSSIVSFVAELNVPVSEIFKKCPKLFSTSKEQISRTIHFLGDAPFFFDTEDIAKMIHKDPDVFLQLDQEEVRKRLNNVYEMLGEDAELHNLLQQSPRMVTESRCLEERMKLFKSWKFTIKHIGYLMNKFPILFIENRVVENVDERLKFILGEDDLTAADVMKFPFCLQMRIVILKCKIGFIRKFAPEVLKSTSLQDIFTAKEDHFAVEICSSNLTTFYSYLKDNFTEADQDWIKKKGKPRASKALSVSF